MSKIKSKKTQLREMDDVWKQKVKDRDNWCCQVCHMKLAGKNCQAHHLLPKRIKGMRWDVDNGMTLCYQHHKVGLYSAHMNAVWFTFWLKTNKPKEFKWIVNKLMELGK